MSDSPSKNTTVYLNGKLVENPHEDHHHVTPIWQFTAVFVGLLILTILTYLVSFAGLGPFSLPVAMIIASMKASLVVLFFMHLLYEDRFYMFVFVTSLLFVSIFFTFTLFDMNTTDELNEEAGIEFYKQINDRAEAADAAAAAAAAPAADAEHDGGGGGH